MGQQLAFALTTFLKGNLVSQVSDFYQVCRPNKDSIESNVLLLWPTSLPSEQDQLVSYGHLPLTWGVRCLEPALASEVIKKHLLSS